MLNLPHYTGSVFAFAAWFYKFLLISYCSFLNIYRYPSQIIIHRFNHLLLNILENSQESKLTLENTKNYLLRKDH